MNGVIYLLFFFSGLSGLIYQVVWVRVFGNVFGNTIYSASMIVSIFMLGLGIGGYVAGAWADRRYRSTSLIRIYGYVELLIGLIGLGVSALFPHLGQLSTLVSSYSRDRAGWYVLSTASYLGRGAFAILLLAPITLLMGATLTLLIRHLVRGDLEAGSWRIALLYAVNTAGAALGCFLTDFWLVPSVGLWGAQAFAVFFNIAAGAGALFLASANPGATTSPAVTSDVNAGRSATIDRSRVSPLAWTALALWLSGFAAMGMEIVWFRHFTLLLGTYRAVYSLLLTVILLGIGFGALIGGFLHRRTEQPSRWLMISQGLFVVTTLLGLLATDVRDLTVRAQSLERSVGDGSALAKGIAELWFNAWPILIEVATPALLMGFAFPLANAIIQHVEQAVGRRAGLLYLSNTVGAVCGALAAGFLLLPFLGLKSAAAVVAAAAWLAILPLHWATRTSPAARRVFVGPSIIGAAAVCLWLLLPSNYLIARALVPPTDNDHVIALSEGVAEVIQVTDDGQGRRRLLTNGHPMSSTGRNDQRYMRALAHIPLLCLDDPRDVLIIGFGVGNTTHAATLHPTVRRVDVADLSRHVLEYSTYFSEANRDVLKDPRVTVYINDGRQHLQMQPPASYDLIALEPPPIVHAGVGALYSREFYALARSRLRPKGYISQWFPAYQAPTKTTLAMIRAFVDIFPNAVLLSGAQPNLQLVGVNDSQIEIDPARIAAALARAPAVQADLARLDLGRVREIVGAFLGSSHTLDEASRGAAPVSDDRPLQEYSVRSLLNLESTGAPPSVVDLGRIAEWCPTCFVSGKPIGVVEGLDTYLAVLARAYLVSVDARSADFADPTTRQMIDDSAYLGGLVRNAAIVRTDLGANLASEGRFDDAIQQFEEALRLEPGLASARRYLAASLDRRGR